MSSADDHLPSQRQAQVADPLALAIDPWHAERHAGLAARPPALGLSESGFPEGLFK